MLLEGGAVVRVALAPVAHYCITSRTIRRARSDKQSWQPWHSWRCEERKICKFQMPGDGSGFEYLCRKVRSFQRRGQPVISVDTKKKEQVGNFKNQGREWRPKGDPEKMRVHDFGKDHVRPHGVYDQTRNEGWVSVGVDHDTAAFAVESIRRWWRWMGRKAYPAAAQLLITADAGGSNGVRVELWKVESQEFADETGLQITVCHFPPGTSKWN